MNLKAIAAIRARDRGLLPGNQSFFFKPKGRVQGKILLLHGFSASPWEVRELGQFLQTKSYLVFAPRLAGHGMTRADFEKAGFLDWLADAREAYNALFKPGERSLLVAHSGGGNLATLLAEEHADEVACMVLGAPAFRLSNPFSLISVFPPVRLFVPQLQFKAEHKDSVYWTLKYSSRCVAELVRAGFAGGWAARKLKSPLLLLQAKEDPLVSRPFNERLFKKIPSLEKEIHVYDTTEHNVFHRYNPHQKQIFDWTYKFLKRYASNSERKSK